LTAQWSVSCPVEIHINNCDYSFVCAWSQVTRRTWAKVPFTDPELLAPKIGRPFKLIWTIFFETSIWSKGWFRLHLSRSGTQIWTSRPETNHLLFTLVYQFGIGALFGEFLFGVRSKISLAYRRTRPVFLFCSSRGRFHELYEVKGNNQQKFLWRLGCFIKRFFKEFIRRRAEPAENNIVSVLTQIPHWLACL